MNCNSFISVGVSFDFLSFSIKKLSFLELSPFNLPDGGFEEESIFIFYPPNEYSSEGGE